MLPLPSQEVFSTQKHGGKGENKIQYSATIQESSFQAWNYDSQTYKQSVPDTKLQSSGATHQTGVNPRRNVELQCGAQLERSKF